MSFEERHPGLKGRRVSGGYLVEALQYNKEMNLPMRWWVCDEDIDVTQLDKQKVKEAWERMYAEFQKIRETHPGLPLVTHAAREFKRELGL